MEKRREDGGDAHLHVGVCSFNFWLCFSSCMSLSLTLYHALIISLSRAVSLSGVTTPLSLYGSCLSYDHLTDFEIGIFSVCSITILTVFFLSYSL